MEWMDFAELRLRFDSRLARARSDRSLLPELENILAEMQTLLERMVGPKPMPKPEPERPNVTLLPKPQMPIEANEKEVRKRIGQLIQTKQREAANLKREGRKAERTSVIAEMNDMIRKKDAIIRSQCLNMLAEDAREEFLGKEAAYSSANQKIEAWQRALERCRNQYAAELANWKIKASRGHGAVWARAIENRRLDLNLLRRGEIPAGLVPHIRVSWRLLPPPESGEAGLQKLLIEIQAVAHGVRLDLLRLKFAYSLTPVRVYLGHGEFGGYLAFEFAGTDRVLLENPVEGNAAYIFSENWKVLSRLSKSELLNNHRSQVLRVLHGVGVDWRRAIRRSLRL